MENEFRLFGPMGFTPELRWTTGSKAVTNISIGVPNGEKDAQGRRQLEWVPVTLWGAAAESACKYGKKGDKYYVQGNIRMVKKDGEQYPTPQLHSNQVRRMMFGEPRAEETTD